MSFIKSLLGSQSVTMSHFAIGDFTLDVVAEENHQITVSNTESAIESGAKITDHRIINPHEVIIRGVVVNYDPKSLIQDYFPTTTSLLEAIPLPFQINAVTDQIKASVNQVKKVASTINNKVNQVSSILNIKNSFVNDTSATDDRITKFKNTLEQIAFNEDLISITTATGSYDNIQVSSVTVVRNNHGSAEFTIYLKEILTYDVEIVGGINATVKTETKVSNKQADKPMGSKKSTRSTQQSATPQNKGKTNPQTTSTKKQSILKKMLG